jgi:hypothetical protein
MDSARDIAERQGSTEAEVAEATSVVILKLGGLGMVA